MTDFNVVIAGSRSFTDYQKLKEYCDIILSNKSKDHNVVIVCGMADGADILGKKYAQDRGYRVVEYKPDWTKYGKAAGFLRNKEMADAADAVICFWDYKSKGTKHMITLAQMRNIPLRVIRF